MRTSFRNRLLLAFATVGLLPLLLASGLISWHSYNTHIQGTSMRQLELAKKVSEQVATLLLSVERDLTLLVKLAGPVRSYDAVRPLLERLLTERQTYREIALLNGAGAERFRLSNIRLIDPARAAKVPLDRELADAVAKGQTYFSRIHHDPSSGEPLMGVAVPAVSPRTGEVIAIVLAEVRVRTIWDLLARQRWQAGEEAFIIDESGLVVAHVNPSVVLSGTHAEPLEGVAWRAGLHAGTVLAVGQGTTINGRFFNVVVERSLASAVRPALEALAMLGGVITLSLLLAALLFMGAVRSVVRPVQAISAVAQAVRDGDLDQRAEVTTDDEIGRLAATLNDMATRLRSVLGDLRVEVEERRQTEAQLIRINNAYQALSGCSGLLAKAERESEILDGVCRIVTEHCQYRLIWLGQLQGTAIVPVASSGFDDGYLGALNIDLTDPVTGHGPTATAFQQKLAVVIDDVQRDQRFAPWRAKALRRGFYSAAAVPLLAGGSVMGVLTVYSHQTAGFSPEEIRLLGELATNVGHGLVALRLRHEREQAEQAVRDSEAKLRRLTNALPALLWTWVSGGSTYFNDRWCDYTGLSEAESVGDGWQRAVHPEDIPALLGNWRDAMAHGHVFGMELRLRRHDGAYNWFLIQAEPIADGTPHPPWVGTCINIEDRKRSETQLIQASKLATLGEMAAGLAHELGQPLNIIRMTADSVAMQLQSDEAPQPARLGRDLALISGQTERMGHLIEHMRAFSRDDNLLQEVFDLGAVAADTAGLLAAHLKAHGIDLEVVRGAPLPVLGNRVQLEQVVLNLMANARDAIKAAEASAHGMIRVVALPGEELGTAQVTVTDNGPGIPAALTERIFEPFVTTKTAGTGTGLGLAICQRIVTQMQGRLQARNLATGAQFVMTLPLSDRTPDTRTGEAKAAAAVTRHRVLVVDDEAAAAEILCQFLDKMGYDVVTAGGGAEALRSFEEHPADIVVTDITMPSGDGLTLLRALRRHAPDLPAVVVTGRIDAASLLADDIAAGHTRLLRKPMSIKALSAEMADLLGAQDRAAALLTT